MPSTGALSKSARKELHVFFVLDTSGSMVGAPIASLNRAVEETIEALKMLSESNGDAAQPKSGGTETCAA